jgi:hypothetical protein
MRKSYRLNEADISLPDYWKDTTYYRQSGEAEMTRV